MKLKFLPIALLSSVALLAQQKELDSSMIKKNIIKTNVTAYVFRNFNLSYERSINKWFSVNIGFGIVPEGKVPFLKSFLNEEDRKDFEDIKIKQTNITIEPRIYLGEGYGKGFYLAPYYRYTSLATNSFTFMYDYEDEITGTTYSIPLRASGKTTANSVGLMIGAQFFLNKSRTLVLDWWIAGGHYGSGKGDFSFESDRTLTPDEQAQLKKNIEELDIPYIKYTVETNPNGAKVKVDGPWAGLRSGLSLGYRF